MKEKLKSVSSGLDKKYKSVTVITAQLLEPGARFSKAPETFRACKAIRSSSVSKNGEVYTAETSCMRGTSIHAKNM